MTADSADALVIVGGAGILTPYSTEAAVKIVISLIKNLVITGFAGHYMHIYYKRFFNQ